MMLTRAGPTEDKMAIITKKDGSFTYSLDTNTGKFKIEQNVGKETHKTNIDWTLPEKNEKAWKAILGKIPTDQKGQWIKGAGKTGESQEAEKEEEEEVEEDEDEEEEEEGVWTKKSKLKDFKAVPFVDRILNPKNYSNAYDVKVGGGIETHNLTVTKLRTNDWAVYPTLQYRKNKLIYRTTPENNNLIKFESEAEAREFAEGSWEKTTEGKTFLRWAGKKEGKLGALQKLFGIDPKAIPPKKEEKKDEVKEAKPQKVEAKEATPAPEVHTWTGKGGTEYSYNKNLPDQIIVTKGGKSKTIKKGDGRDDFQQKRAATMVAYGAKEYKRKYPKPLPDPTPKGKGKDDDKPWYKTDAGAVAAPLLGLMGLDVALQSSRYFFDPLMKQNRAKIKELAAKEKRGELGRDKALEQFEYTQLMRPARAVAEQAQMETEATMAGMGESLQPYRLSQLQMQKQSAITNAMAKGQQAQGQRIAQRAAQEKGELESRKVSDYQARGQIYKSFMKGASSVGGRYGEIMAAQAQLKPGQEYSEIYKSLLDQGIEPVDAGEIATRLYESKNQAQMYESIAKFRPHTPSGQASQKIILDSLQTKK